MRAHFGVSDNNLVCLDGDFACFTALTINGLPYSLLPAVMYGWKQMVSMHFVIVLKVQCVGFWVSIGRNTITIFSSMCNHLKK